MKAKKIISTALALLMMLSVFSGGLPTVAASDAATDLRLWYDEPASGTSNTTNANGIWQSSTLPIGNGKIGANVYGEYATEHLTLNEETLWSGGRGSVSNYDGGNVSHSDSEWTSWVSQVASGSFNAETLAGDSASSSGYYNGYQALGDLYFSFGHSGVSNYTRELNLETGVSSVTYTYGGVTYTREYFVANDPNVLVCRFSASGGTLSFTTTLSSKQSASASYSTSGGDGYISCAGTVSNNGLLHNTQAYIVSDGSVSASTSGVTVSGATSATVYLSAATDYATTFSSGSTDWYYRTGESAAQLAARVKADIDDAKSDGYSSVRAAYNTYYTDLFGRVSVDLGQSSSKTTDALLSGYSSASAAEKRYLEVLQYQYGRYLLICGSSESSQLPTTLQGIWNNNNSAPWYSDIHTNINLEMNYWLAGTGNLAECLKPLAEYMEAMYEPGNYTVQCYTDADTGMMMHTQNTPFGYTSPGWSISTWGWSPSASTWLLQNCYDYYEYTQDSAYLTSTLFPLLVKQCEMYRQLLETDSSGKYVFPIAYSPEHGSVTYGNTYEQSIIWQLFQDTIEAAYALGYSSSDVIYSAKGLTLANVENIFANLKGIVVGSNSIGSYIKEWYSETYYGQYGESSHRHISQLLGAYPGNMLTTDALKTAAANTLTLRGTNTVSGWSLAQRACTWAAVGNGESAYTYIKYVLTNGVMQNLWGYHSYGGYGGENKAFQIDANYGYSAAVNEMLLQSNYGYIDMIPAIPSAWSSGSFSGLAAEGGFDVDCTWTDGKASTAAIASGSGGACSIKWDVSDGLVLIVTDSAGAAVDYTYADGIYTFATAAGETYTVTEGENIPVSYEYTLGAIAVTASRTSLTAAEITWTECAVTPASSAVTLTYTLAKNGTVVYAGTGASYTDNEASDTAEYTVTASLTLNGESAAYPVSAAALLSGTAIPVYASGAISQTSIAGGTTYVLDTDGIESGVYALIIYNTNNESPSNYYIASTDMKSDSSPYGLITTVVTDCLSSDRTTVDFSPLTSRSYLWNVTKSGSYYTVSAADGSGTMSINGQSNVNLSGSNTSLALASGGLTNAYYVAYSGSNGYRLDMYSDRDGYKPTNGQCLLSAWSTGGTSNHNNIYFYRQVVDESEVGYTADTSYLNNLVTFAQGIDAGYYANYTSLGIESLITSSQNVCNITADTDITTAQSEQDAVNSAAETLYDALLQLSVEQIDYGYVTINCIDDAGAALKASETLTGVAGESYTVTPEVIDNYTTPAAVSGTYGRETTETVTLVYTLNTDKTALAAELNNVTAQGDYTDASYADYTAAIAAGQTVYDAARAMQTEVDAAVTAITTAKANLKIQVYYGYVTVNCIDDAGAALKASETLTGVAGESYTVTPEAIDNYTTPAAVSGTYGRETTETVTLVYTLNTDKTALAAELNNITAQGDYTDASYANYTATIAAGQAVYDAARAMQTEVDAAVTAITTAKANLVSSMVVVSPDSVSVSSSVGAYSTYYTSNAIDGSISTYYWASAAQASGAYFTVDFGGVYTINSVSIVSNYYNDYIRGANVQYSADRSTWTTLGTIAGSGTSTPMTVTTDDYVDARYVRIVLTVSSNYWWVVNEIEFTFGPESTYVPQTPTIPVFTLDTDGITSGGEYIIKTGTADYALAIVNGSLSSAAVTVENGTVSTDNDNYVWIITSSGSGYTIRNKGTGQYLYYSRRALTISSSASTWYASYTGSYARLYTVSSKSYYIRYSGSFGVTSSAGTTCNLLLYIGE